VFPRDFCDAAKKPSGVWIEYWWAKPGEKEGSRKVSYLLSAKGTLTWWGPESMTTKQQSPSCRN
jgi:hypothetical protein